MVVVASLLKGNKKTNQLFTYFYQPKCTKLLFLWKDICKDKKTKVNGRGLEGRVERVFSLYITRTEYRILSKFYIKLYDIYLYVIYFYISFWIKYNEITFLFLCVHKDICIYVVRYSCISVEFSIFA